MKKLFKIGVDVPHTGTSGGWMDWTDIYVAADTLDQALTFVRRKHPDGSIEKVTLKGDLYDVVVDTLTL